MKNFIVRKEQYERLARSSYESYVRRIASKLLEDRYSESRSRWFPSGASMPELESVIFGLVEQAEGLGIVLESDVTPYLLLRFTMKEACPDEGLEAWIMAVLEAKDHPSRNRMRAIFDLLPANNRSLVFP